MTDVDIGNKIGV